MASLFLMFRFSFDVEFTLKILDFYYKEYVFSLLRELFLNSSKLSLSNESLSSIQWLLIIEFFLSFPKVTSSFGGLLMLNFFKTLSLTS